MQKQEHKNCGRNFGKAKQASRAAEKGQPKAVLVRKLCAWHADGDRIARPGNAVDTLHTDAKRRFCLQTFLSEGRRGKRSQTFPHHEGMMAERFNNAN
jgi:hypothetical protein